MNTSVRKLEFALPQTIVGFDALPADWFLEGWEWNAPVKRMQRAWCYRRKELSKTPRILFVLHGYGEHGGRYSHLPAALQAQVDVVFVLDHVGHGRSTGQRGDFTHFDQMTDDAAAAVVRVMAEFGAGARLSLLGHSMGGHVAVRFMLRYPQIRWASATVSAPFFGVKTEIPVLKKKIGLFLAQIPVLRRIPLNVEINASALSHEQPVGEAYMRDPWVHHSMTPRAYLSLTNTMQETLQSVQTIQDQIPFSVLFLVPLADQVVNPALALQCFRSLKAGKKKCVELAGFYHEVLNETRRAEAFKEMIENLREGWIHFG